MAEEPIDQQLAKLVAEHKSFVAVIGEQIKTLGGVTPETKAAFAVVTERLDKIQTQVDGIDLANRQRTTTEMAEAGIGELYVKDERFLREHKESFRSRNRITIPFNRSAFASRKSLITSDSSMTAGTAGIPMPMLLSPIPLPMAQQELRLRQIMRVRKMDTGNTYYWLKQTTRTNAASPQTEGSAKAESTYLWTTASADVKTIAHFVNVTKQALDDIPFLRSTIDSELMYGLLVAEESEILIGSGTGEHLNGLVTQATAYSTAYDVAGDTDLDKLRHAKLQARLAGKATYAPSGIVLHPKDMHDLELIKTDEGATANKGIYIIGDPKTGTPVKFVWGLPVVESDSMQMGKFLVGAFATGAEIVDRQEATIDISFEHASNFTENKATIRAEERIGLAVMRPDAFIYDSF